MALSIIVSAKDFAAHTGKSPVAGWLVGRGSAHSAAGQWLSPVGPHKHQMSSVMLPGEERSSRQKLKVDPSSTPMPHKTPLSKSACASVQ